MRCYLSFMGRSGGNAGLPQGRVVEYRSAVRLHEQSKSNFIVANENLGVNMFRQRRLPDRAGPAK
jgi:hypothetical protein